jgi:preprotein translocase SecE subunit
MVESKSKAKQTVRERSQSGGQGPQKHHLRATAAKPLKVAAKTGRKAASPFSFLATPFNTKTGRFIRRWLARLLLINYVTSSYRELRVVKWPNKRETVRLTIAVFVFSIVFGFVISASDFGLDKLFQKVLLR